MQKIIIMAIAIFSIAFSACKKEAVKISETAGLIKVQELSNEDYIIEVYTESGALQLGYNDIYLRLKNKLTGNYEENATLDWMPEMHMVMMTHSCPKSAIEKVSKKQTLYKGYIVFQMPENKDEHWNLTIDYTVGETTGTVSDQISVPNSTYKNVASFTGSDSKKYIIALVQPQQPVVAVNDFIVGLFTMETMSKFPPVENFSILSDPRMPDMGNHSSPNNVSPAYNATDKLYHGKLSLTMTGEWRLNFIIKNADNDIIKGEAITEENESSSLFLDIKAK